MPELSAFPPLRAETILTIRARIDADINAGVDPSDPAFLDTMEGDVYWDMTQGLVIESERLWDFASVEVPAASFPIFAWGVYLDMHGVTVGLTRKDEVQATGVVLITGDPGTLIPTGIRLATTQTDPDADPIVFESIESVVLAASPGPTGLAAVATGTGGTLPVATYYYVVTAIIPNPRAAEPGQPATVETVISNEVSATTPGGGTAKVTLTWAAVTGALNYNVYRSQAPAGETFLHQVGAVLTFVDTGAYLPSSTKPPTNLVGVQAVNAGVEGNVAAGAITQLLSPVAGVNAVTNPAAISGGAEVESDEQFQNRILLEYSTPQGAGNQGDYVRWGLAYAPIGFVTVEPLWAGAGTVRVIITDQQNNPVSPTVIAGLQTVLDPVAGMGSGLAPVGAIVTVATPSVLATAVAATLELDAGYSIDGAGGTIAVRADVNAAIAEYINRLAPGDDVILEHVKSRLFAVQGIHDVSGVTLNGAAANVAVSALQVAQMGVVTLA